MNQFALPSDIVSDLPRMTVLGQLHVYIENHQGLVVYSETELTVKTHTGMIRIQGTDFVLKMMLPQELLLEGKINDVSYITS
ncbi:sporulation protein YqfC [Virgibacillus phasianinus]|uniref:Sporulation protein YqfC n=2 Tax=Virgibacillus phasianinus TaxID=2017483 RepID=A0A220U8Q2_9BACI|nr:sporulation protein YqfC [Virgibacillus phasianinus]